MLRPLALLLTLFCAPSVHAGAWAREEGQSFIAIGGNFFLSDGAELPVYYDPTLYVEYGWTERLTVGADFYMADRNFIGAGTVFARVPLGSVAGRSRWAASAGIGTRHEVDVGTEALLRGGIHWGYGFDRGWAAVDASATMTTLDRRWRPKVDLTGGFDLSENWTISLQLQTGQGFTDDFYAKINPNIVWTYSDGVRVSLGAVRALTGDEGGALKLETWLTF